MSRISKAFANKRAFIGYLTAGDAGKKDFLELTHHGVNVLEVGIPFSDPVADGPVIQKAMMRALQKGMTPAKALDIVREIRAESDVAIVVFTYLNPIQKDLKAFLSQAKQAGADGILIVDLPLEEADEYRFLCDRVGLDPIFLIAPSTPPERIERLSRAGRGFLYYACRKGTTGARTGLPEDLREKVAVIRAKSSLPIAVGFGISERKTADAILTIADGFVVGSHFVEGNRSL
ncbi:MAG: tryptophan synthase subunit alpha [Verrucomicrobia bacterium]|nr:tryptophan synthase subunit alpha [Verrucomicrobiota bacterium]MDE3047234.1 tryptophan synthase subunit alpha [Verrucomicrobiota bacterium]